MDKQLFRNATRHKIIQAAIFLFVIFCIPPTIAQQKIHYMYRNTLISGG